LEALESVLGTAPDPGAQALAQAAAAVDAVRTVLGPGGQPGALPALQLAQGELMFGLNNDDEEDDDDADYSFFDDLGSDRLDDGPRNYHVSQKEMESLLRSTKQMFGEEGWDFDLLEDLPLAGQDVHGGLGGSSAGLQGLSAYQAYGLPEGRMSQVSGAYGGAAARTQTQYVPGEHASGYMQGPQMGVPPPNLALPHLQPHPGQPPWTGPSGTGTAAGSQLPERHQGAAPALPPMPASHHTPGLLDTHRGVLQTQLLLSDMKAVVRQSKPLLSLRGRCAVAPRTPLGGQPEDRRRSFTSEQREELRQQIACLTQLLMQQAVLLAATPVAPDSAAGEDNAGDSDDNSADDHEDSDSDGGPAGATASRPFFETLPPLKKVSQRPGLDHQRAVTWIIRRHGELVERAQYQHPSGVVQNLACVSPAAAQGFQELVRMVTEECREMVPHAYALDKKRRLAKLHRFRYKAVVRLEKSVLGAEFAPELRFFRYKNQSRTDKPKQRHARASREEHILLALGILLTRMDTPLVYIGYKVDWSATSRESARKYIRTKTPKEMQSPAKRQEAFRRVAAQCLGNSGDGGDGQQDEAEENVIDLDSPVAAVAQGCDADSFYALFLSDLRPETSAAQAERLMSAAASRVHRRERPSPAQQAPASESLLGSEATGGTGAAYGHVGLWHTQGGGSAAVAEHGHYSSSGGDLGMGGPVLSSSQTSLPHLTFGVNDGLSLLGGDFDHFDAQRTSAAMSQAGATEASSGRHGTAPGAVARPAAWGAPGAGSGYARLTSGFVPDLETDTGMEILSDGEAHGPSSDADSDAAAAPTFTVSLRQAGVGATGAAADRPEEPVANGQEVRNGERESRRDGQPSPKRPRCNPANLELNMEWSRLVFASVKNEGL
jgi:hypothetical protein